MNNVMTMTNTQTMTSVEVVEVINSLRPKDAPILLHNNFMRRCERVAEELGAISPDRGDYLDKQGQSRTCYLLDKEMC